MAETFGFFDAEELTDGTFDREYIAEQWANYFKLFVGNGVFATPTNQLKVVAYTGMFVKISIGWAFINGYWYHNDTELEVEIPANMTASTITDGIFIRWDSANREIKAVVGVDRTTPNRVAPYYELKLADIVVSTGATQITDAEITDTRMDSSVCGIVTGIIDVIDAGNLFAQYESIFTQWMNSTDTDFDEWRDDQEALYTQWYNAIKAQQTQDLEDFDAWFDAIKGQLSEDAAGHLQNEIDDIIAQGLSGSIFTITTTQTELYGKDVTITGANVTKTGKFSAQGVAVITGFTDVGTITITSTDNLETATTVMSIPYFGRYTATLAFWSATVNLEGNESLYGSVITVKDSDNLTVGTVTLSVLDGTGVFIATKADTYTFNYTVNGTAYSIPLAVTEETTYELSLTAGFDYEQWVTLGGLDPTDYSSLSEVFADEVAVRRLMTIHASADYLIEKVTDDVDIMDDFTANDTAMKWIGLRDYVCDGLTSITGVEAKFLASDYWERYLKDHVPVMTSDTAPYGTASANSYDGGGSFNPWKALDGDDTSYWRSYDVPPAWVAYKFVNPICVKRIKIKPALYGSGLRVLTYKVQGSNTGDTNDYTDIYSGSLSSADEQIVNITNNDYYLYYRVYVLTAAEQASAGIITLQFYGRALDVSVPVMTSNTAPYGEVGAIPTATSSDDWIYRAFNRQGPDTYGTTGQTNNDWNYLYYKYPHAVEVKVADFMVYDYSIYSGKQVKLFYSDDGTTWTAASDAVTSVIGKVTQRLVAYDAVGKHRYWAIGLYNGIGAYYTISFYSSNYYEREFAEGSTMKYLYDHGLELETLTYSNANNDGDKIVLNAVSGAYAMSNQIDFTDYSVLRAVIGDSNGNGGGFMLVDDTNAPSYSANTWTSYLLISDGSNPDVSLDVVSITQELYCGFSTNKVLHCKELWLE